MQSGFGAEVTYISLGSHCTPSLRLNQLQLRTLAYPFDWLISPFDALCKTLESDFADFFTELTMIENCSGAVDYDGHTFTHDWPTIVYPSINLSNVDWVPNNTIVGDWKAMIPTIAEKYRRRINRFRNICLSEEKIVFIRFDDINKTTAKKLVDLIKKKYPTLDFMLVALSLNEEFKTSWNLEFVRNHRVDPHDSEKWMEILSQVSYELISALPRASVSFGKQSEDPSCDDKKSAE
jgi:hypothetical protein